MIKIIIKIMTNIIINTMINVINNIIFNTMISVLNDIMINDLCNNVKLQITTKAMINVASQIISIN